MRSRGAVSLSRRAFFARAAGSAPPPLRPPWIREETLRSLCTSCGDCAKACPEEIIAIGAKGLPALSFAEAGCTFCGRCAEACPEEGLFDRSLDPALPATAEIGPDCLNAQGVLCQSCRDACGYRAIRFPPLPGSAAEIDSAACTGCGACLPSCPVGAIKTLHTT